jgi:hypothetical protein
MTACSNDDGAHEHFFIHPSLSSALPPSTALLLRSASSLMMLSEVLIGDRKTPMTSRSFVGQDTGSPDGADIIFYGEVRASHYPIAFPMLPVSRAESREMRRTTHKYCRKEAEDGR